MGALQAKRPLDVVAMDSTLLELGTNHVENVLVMIGVFARYTQVFQAHDQKARTVANTLFMLTLLSVNLMLRIMMMTNI